MEAILSAAATATNPAAFTTALAFGTAALSKIIYIILILAACSVATKILQNLVARYFSLRLKTPGNLPGSMTEQKKKTLLPLIQNVIKGLFLFIAAVSVLSQLGIDVASIITVAGIGAVAVALGAQSLMSDFIGGFFILSENLYEVGDLVTIQGKTGTVEVVSLRTTRLRAADGTVYIVPNGKVDIVTNMSREFICATVDVGVDYGADIPQVLKVLNDEMAAFAQTAEGLRKTPTVLGVTELADSAVTIRILAECTPGQQFAIERAIRLAVKQRLDREGISIPFPQRTVHLAKED